MRAPSSAPRDEAAQPDDAHHEEEAPRIELSPRALASFGAFVVLAVVALYFLLPKLAGLHDTSIVKG